MRLMVRLTNRAFCHWQWKASTFGRSAYLREPKLPKEPTLWWNHTVVKKSRQSTRQIMNFNALDYAEFTDVAQVPHCHSPLKNNRLLSFRVIARKLSTVTWKTLMYHLCKLHVCVNVEFLHILRPKQLIAINANADRKIQLPSFC